MCAKYLSITARDVLFIVVFVLFFKFGGVVSAETGIPNFSKYSDPSFMPVLSEIVKLDPPSCSEKECKIPWIANMINGIYKWLIGIVGMVSAVVMMYGKV